MNVPTTPSVPDGLAALGVTKEAFDAAGAALESISEGRIAEASGDAAEVPAAALPETPVAPAAATAPAAETPRPPAPPVSASWAAVKKAEQQISQERAQLRREINEVKRMRESMTAAQKTQTDIIAELKKDPRSLEKHGLSIQEFLDRVLTDNKLTPEGVQRTANDETKALRQELQEIRGLLQQRDAQTAEEKFMSRIDTELSKPDFELLATHPDAKGEAIRFAAGYFQKFGKMDLTAAEIAGHLQDTWQEHLKSLSSAKAVRKVLGLPDQTPDGDVEPEPTPPSRTQPAVKTKPRTVSPGMAAAPARSTPAPRVSRQSEEDIVREAAKLVPTTVWDSME